MDAAMQDSLAPIEPLASAALVLAAASGVCALLGIVLIVVDARRDRRAGQKAESTAPTDPEVAGFLVTGLVTLDAGRWVPAAIVSLACDRELAIIDRRPNELDEDLSWEPSELFLEFTGDPRSVALFSKDGETGRQVIRALFGSTPRRGDQVAVDRSGTTAVRLSELTVEGMRSAGTVYFNSLTHEIQWKAAMILTFLAAAGGLAAIVMALVAEDGGVALASFSAFLLGVVAYIVAAVVGGGRISDVFRKLSRAGELLRAGAEESRYAIERAEIRTVAEGERLLPWAVLFGLGAPVDRLGEAIEASDRWPDWYRCEHPATKRRFAACIVDLESRMRAPRAVYLDTGGL